MDIHAPMEISHIRSFAHAHCRFKLRSGKEVFGVIWEVESTAPHGTATSDKRFFFSSIGDYERMRSQGTAVQVIPMEAEEIMWAERLAS